MIRFLTFSFFFLSFQVSAGEICGRTGIDIKEALLTESKRISFKNNGGLINGGVCWWHSRLQRSSVYLVKYAPEKKPLTGSQVDALLEQLRRMDSVVEIPGFKDFKTFTAHYKKNVQSMLERWQKIDGFLNQQWIRGLSGRSSLPSQEMKMRMDSIFNFYKKSPTPVWIMAQIKGITSHSFLLVDMEKTGSGYQLSLIDSNRPLDTKIVTYYYGDKSLKYPSDRYSFVPYVGFQKDFLAINEAIKNECGVSESFRVEEIPMGDIEI